MGLISLIKNVAGTITGSIGDEVRDQYLEFFTCDSLGDNILVKKGANRIQKGREPACVEGCTASACFFGDLDDPESIVSKKLAARESFTLLPEAGTAPQVYYLK